MVDEGKYFTINRARQFGKTTTLHALAEYLGQDFLAQLRGYYINRSRFATFQSVILAGVCDIRNLKRKMRGIIQDFWRWFGNWFASQILCLKIWQKK